MANTLKFKRGLLAGLPTAAEGEPLFTTDTKDLYIGTSTGNQRFQKYIASGATTQILRGDGSLYSFPLAISSPSNGQVLKFNGTNWVNDSDAGITGSGSANQVAFFTGATTQAGSNFLVWNNTNGYLGIGTNVPNERLHVTSSAVSTAIFGHDGANGGIDMRNTGTLASNRTSQIRLSNGTTFFGANDRTYQLVNQGRGASTADLYVQYWDGTNYFDRFRLFASGNFGIGTGTAETTERLQVNGTAKITGNVGIGTASDVLYPLKVERSTAGVGIQVYNSTTYSQIRLQSSGINQSSYLTLNPTGTGRAIIQVSDTDRVIIDASGNFGVGVAPSSWGTGLRAIQFGGNGGLVNNSANSTSLTHNNFYNGSNFIYLVSSQQASYFAQTNGNFIFYTAPSGTAGNAVTFTQAMTLYNTGNLAIGSSASDTGERLQVTGSAKITGAAVFGGNFTIGTLALGTGLYWDNTNNRLGIGMSLPTSQLHIRRSSGATITIESTDAGFSATPVETNLNFNGYGASLQSQISSQDRQANVVGGWLYFRTKNSSNVLTDRFFVDRDGLVTFLGAASITGNLTVDTNTFFVDSTNNSVAIGTTTINGSAVLQADSTTKGFLPPRMTTTQRNAIATPAAGLVVYDTTDNKHYGYNGTTWNAFF